MKTLAFTLLILGVAGCGGPGITIKPDGSVKIHTSNPEPKPMDGALD